VESLVSSPSGTTARFLATIDFSENMLIVEGMAFVPDNRRYLTQRLPDAGVKRLQRVVAVKSRTINSNVRRSGKMRARREESAMLKTSSRSVRATDRSAGQYRLLLSRRLSIHDGQDQCGGRFQNLKSSSSPQLDSGTRGRRF